MANTYTQIYIHVVFAVQGRQNLIHRERKGELQKYITGIITRQKQKLIAIHCMPDHTHLLIGMKPDIALSDLVGDIKTGSTNHINENRWVQGRVDFPCVTGVKRRPAIVVSTDTYHAARPDVVLCVVTTKIAKAGAPTDLILQDWAAAGLNKPLAFRSFFVMLPARSVVSVIGQLSDRAWTSCQSRLQKAIAIV